MGINQSTIAFNTATTSGGGIYSTGTVNLLNSIVANNTNSVSPDINGNISQANFSIVGNTSGTTIISNNSTQTNVNPLLGVLDNYGGPTQTIPILINSPAIGGGVGNIGTPDQRGVNYVTADVGSYANYVDPLLVANSTANSGPGSLRNVIDYAATVSGTNFIYFDGTLAGSTISLTAPLTINDTTGGVIIQGLGQSNLTISGGGNSGIFNIQTPATILSITLSNGTGIGSSPNIQGGAIYSNSTITLNDVAINHSTADYGSAIYETGGSLTLTSSNIANSIYFTGNGNLSISGGLVDSDVTISSANTVSILNYSSSLERLTFHTANSIILNNITVSGNLSRSSELE
jgi:predicted outer membrane repeat protein